MTSLSFMYTNDVKKVSVDLHKANDIYGVVMAFHDFLLACGYSEAKINQYIKQPETRIEEV